ncbi:Fungal specific transcription factor domain-containing protein [Cladophialophora immunda]|nr:Fungal specific transcription factor domain-containing protein [Cladophialophora immunda]
MEIQRSRRGCAACRMRHLKCDEAKPLVSDVKPRGDSVRKDRCFHNGENPRRAENRAPTSIESHERSVVTFVTDSTIEEILSQHSPKQQDGEPTTGASKDSSPIFSAGEATSISQLLSNDPTRSTTFQCTSMDMTFTELSSIDFMDMGDFVTEVSTTDSDTGIACETRSLEARSGQLVDRHSLIKDRTEAHLLRHYCQKLAPWFDVTDSNRHFQLEVPRRASTCDVLLNAIFALSALHLSRVSSLDPSISESYHSRCNSQLIPLLNDRHCAANVNLLATVVILRKYEELSVVVTGQDHGHHLAGVSALFSSPDCPFNDGLAQAAFWQFVRQDIYMSLPRRRPPRTSILIQPPLTNDRTMPDCHWANRMVWGTLAIMALCFRDERPDIATYENHSQRVKDWHDNKPTSFTPMYRRERSVVDGRYFPEIWLSDPWHATAWQYYHLSKILLALYNPHLQRPAADLKYQRDHNQLERDVLEHARFACGIASSNDFATTRFTLSAIMLTCGGWFKDPQEQEAIIDLLSATSKESGWPTKSVIEALRESWAVE